MKTVQATSALRKPPTTKRPLTDGNLRLVAPEAPRPLSPRAALGNAYEASQRLRALLVGMDALIRPEDDDALDEQDTRTTRAMIMTVCDRAAELVNLLRVADTGMPATPAVSQ